MRCRKTYSKGYAQIHFAPRVTKFPIIYSVNFPRYITCLHVTTMGTSVCEILQIKPLTSDTPLP